MISVAWRFVSLERVQQGAGVGADVSFLDGLVEVQRLLVDEDLHAAAVRRRDQRGHQGDA